jgi:YD repeat-containing protein
MQLEQPMSLDELKTTAQQYNEIKTDGDAPWVPLKSWNGLSGSTKTPYMSVTVDYHLEGNRVCVTRALDQQEYWYTLR